LSPPETSFPGGGPGVAKQRRQFKVPSYTLIYIRNSQIVKANEVIAQISTISRKTNATDEASLTIESEYEGQFYSKTLSFREKFLGDAKLMESGLKDFRGLQNPLHNDIFPFSPKTILPQNGLQSIDKIYEAWTWGYAWVLSGKIYELSLPGEICFPIFGDLVNFNSCMNQTQWNLNFNNGPANLHFMSTKSLLGGASKNKPASKSLLISKDNPLNKTISSSNVNVKQPLYFTDLLKVRFHKMGYVLTSHAQSPFLEKSLFKTNEEVNSPQLMRFSNAKSPNFLGKDLLYRIYQLRPNRLNHSDSTIKTVNKGELKKGRRTLLHWFPNQYQTSTGGFLFFEDIFKCSKIYSDIQDLPSLALKSSPFTISSSSPLSSFLRFSLLSMYHLLG